MFAIMIVVTWDCKGLIVTTSSAGDLYPTQRQRELARIVGRLGRVQAADAAERFNVSTETIRKDLIELERRGLLRRVHGGAVPADDFGFEQTLTARTGLMEQKRRIARAAVAELPDSGAVLLDNGSTMACLADEFPADSELGVFTSSLPVALALTDRPRLTVSTLGGRIRGVTLAEVGNWAIRALREVRVDVVFLGTNGLTVEHGLTTPNEAEATVKRLMLEAGARRVLLADHSKVGTVSMLRYADLCEIDLVITDDGLAQDEVTRLASVTTVRVV